MGIIYQELETKNGTIRGFLHQPKSKNKVPLVILYHGFTGSKNSNNFLFGQFAKYLEKKGIASLRFDFTGTGDSDCEFHDMTFSNELDEAHQILNYAKTLPFVNRIVVLGLSMGGAIATQICKERSDDVSQLILWAPAGNMGEYARKADEMAIILDNGNYDMGGIELSKAFVEEMKTMDLFDGINSYMGPVAIFQGTLDERVPVSIAEKYHELYHNSQLFIIEDGDHTFNSVQIRQKLFELNVQFIKNF